jgi:hypothetical protein
MTMTLNGTTGLQMPDGSPISSGEQVARAWVNFNGTGVVAIRDSYNVTSITDNGTGDYTVNYTSALPNANYCCVAGCGVTGTLPSSSSRGAVLNSLTAASARVYMTTGAGVATDYDIVTVAALAGQ